MLACKNLRHKASQQPLEPVLSTVLGPLQGATTMELLPAGQALRLFSSLKRIARQPTPFFRSALRGRPFSRPLPPLSLAHALLLFRQWLPLEFRVPNPGFLLGETRRVYAASALPSKADVSPSQRFVSSQMASFVSFNVQRAIELILWEWETLSSSTH